MSAGASRRGIQRERQVVALLQSQDWIAFRSPASLGCADVIALKDGHRPRLIEVKSTSRGPYEHFGPAARARLLFAAELAGAEPLLCWWPARSTAVWIGSIAWPA